MKPLQVALFGFLLTPGLACAAGLGHAPTRMQLCQQEVSNSSGEQRKQLLRECLSRRADGELAVTAECQRQLRLGPKRTAAEHRQLQACETRALAVPSSRLPRRPPPPPEPPPVATPGIPGLPSARPAPVRTMPTYSVREGA